MPIEDYRAAATTISEFLKLLVTTGGLRLKYRITAGEGAADPDGLEAREIYVEIAGPDAALVTQRNGELLRALEHGYPIRLVRSDYFTQSVDTLADLVRVEPVASGQDRREGQDRGLRREWVPRGSADKAPPLGVDRQGSGRRQSVALAGARVAAA